VKDWYYVGPHVMIVLPDGDMKALKGSERRPLQRRAYLTSL